MSSPSGGLGVAITPGRASRLPCAFLRDPAGRAEAAPRSRGRPPESRALDTLETSYRFAPSPSRRARPTHRRPTARSWSPRRTPLWGARARDWAQLAEPDQTPFYVAVFDELQISSSTRLLDVGCGAGLALTLAAKRGALVAGLDAAEGLLAVARERLPDTDIRAGDLEQLPYPDDTFTAATSFNAVQYAANPQRALRELARVTIPGSPIAVVTWGDPARSDMRDVLSAIGALLPPPPPGAAGPFALSAPGALETLVEPAGLRPGATGEVPTPYLYPDVATAVRAQSSSGPATRAIQHSGEQALRDALTAVMKHHQHDGGVRLNNVFRYLIAWT